MIPERIYFWYLKRICTLRLSLALANAEYCTKFCLTNDVLCLNEKVDVFNKESKGHKVKTDWLLVNDVNNGFICFSM